MSPALAQTRDVQRLRDLVNRELGLYIDDSRLAPLGELLIRRAAASDVSIGAYLDRLDSRAHGAELRALASALTIGETYFFRHPAQFRALTEHVLPERMRARGDTHRLSLLSAACSTGEEAYSLAIAARDRLAGTDWKVAVRAIDINPEVLARAARARYSAWALRDTPPAQQRRWFRRDGSDFVLDESIRTAVRFDLGNLVRDDPGLWRIDSYDVIFCRNVLMYFSPEQTRAAVARLCAALAPGGFLFLGHAETLRGISHDFRLCHVHDAFFYQRADAQPSPTMVATLPRVSEAGTAPVASGESISSAASVASVASDEDAARSGPSSGPGGPAAPAAPAAPDAVAAIDPSAPWQDSIRRSSDRVRVLSQDVAVRRRRGTSRPHTRDASRPPGPRIDLGAPLALLREERFAEALAAVDALPAATAGHLEARLLRAALLTHGGRLGDAEVACRALIADDELNAGAHYLLALCRDGSQDGAAAAEHARIAAYLNPSFAMPRVHLGLMARRAGEVDVARRELGQAAVLLEREDPERLLLFGGGFTREALIALCGSAGGAP